MKICVVTTNRADYGLLRPVLHEIAKHKELSFDLVVTGSHLLQSSGMTIDEIRAENMPVSCEIPLFAESASADNHAAAIGEGVKRFDVWFRQSKPDCVLVLGDRFELFSIVVPAFLDGIPIVHLCGGDITLGAIDESVRHAVTKLASLHFTNNAESRNRVLQMGEQPDRVFNVGHTAIDNLGALELYDQETLCRDLNIDFAGYNVLMTFHPETLTPDKGLNALQNTLTVLGELGNTRIFITGSNIDSDFDLFQQEIDAFTTSHTNAKFFSSLGTRRYFSLMAQIDLVIGNSSSGLMEAPYFKAPTIDIGNRQQGRLRGNSVIHSDGNMESLKQAIAAAKAFDRKTIVSPYGAGGAATRIADTLAKFANTSIPLKKEWYKLG